MVTIEFVGGPQDGAVLKCDREPNLYYELPFYSYPDFTLNPVDLILKWPKKHVYELKMLRGPIAWSRRFQYVYKGVE